VTGRLTFPFRPTLYSAAERVVGLLDAALLLGVAQEKTSNSFRHTNREGSVV
jgi:hypothetical protein